MTTCENPITHDLGYGRRFSRRGPPVRPVLTIFPSGHWLQPFRWSVPLLGQPCHALYLPRGCLPATNVQRSVRNCHTEFCTPCCMYEENTAAEEKSIVNCEVLEFLFCLTYCCRPNSGGQLLNSGLIANEKPQNRLVSPMAAQYRSQLLGRQDKGCLRVSVLKLATCSTKILMC